MHADVRSGIAGTCPICKMRLIPRSTRLGNYRMEVQTVPDPPVAGQLTSLGLLVRDPHSQARVRDFELLHDRFLHLFVVSQDLEFFAHVHPHLDADGRLSTDLVLPRQAMYEMYADFTPAGGTPQLLQRGIIVKGSRAVVADGRVHLSPDLASKIDGSVRVGIHAPDMIAGRQQLLTFSVENAETSEPVRDLEPYLGAQAHLFSVSDDLADAFHSHPIAEVSSATGPDVSFQVAFARAGAHRVWVQVQRAGRVSTVAFNVAVLPALQDRSD